MKEKFLMFIVVFGLLNKQSINAQEKKVDSCFLIVDSIQIKELIIIDQTMANVIDSAIGMIKRQPVNGFNIPYYLEMYIDDNSLKQQIVSFYARNFFLYGSTSEMTANNYEGNYCLCINGNQILVDSKFLNQSWLNKYIKLSGNIISYYVYCFYTKEKKICERPNRIIGQNIRFHLWTGKKKPFSFEQYILTNDDNTFIYDNESFR